MTPELVQQELPAAVQRPDPLKSGFEGVLTPADFETSNAPTWDNVAHGPLNLIDAVRRHIQYVQPDNCRVYSPAERTTTRMVRPRGWHLRARHLELDGRDVPAARFDHELVAAPKRKRATGQRDRPVQSVSTI